MGRGYQSSKYDGFDFSPVNGNYVQNGWDDELKEEDVWREEESHGSHDHTYFEWKETDWTHSGNGTSMKSRNGRKSYLSIELHAEGVRERHQEHIGVGFAMPENGGTKGGWAPGFLARKVKLSQFSTLGGAGTSKYSNGWYDHRDDAAYRGGVPQSAPVSVPVWPSKQGSGAGSADGAEPENCKCNGEDDDNYEIGGDDGDGDGDGDDDDDDDDDDGHNNHVERIRGRLAPHEIVDREYARSQKTTFSVVEGAGRTLKGMDLRRVRNAVWNRMGFVD